MNLRRAVHTNTRLQRGCYISDVTEFAPDVSYVSSDLVDDNVWNRATLIGRAPEKALLSKIVIHAKARKRAPVIALDAHAVLPSGFDVTASEPERWMRCTGDGRLVAPKPTDLTLSVVDSPVPSDAFFRVFGNLFADQAINRLFDQYYIPALRHAIHVESKVRHFVGWVNQDPVGCASIYFLGESAGLYNVGTRVDMQSRGIGRYLSRVACDHAFNSGARDIILQAVADTHVERMYRDLGFTDVDTLTILTFQPTE